MARPSISIITPCNRVIPWFNAHLINVCSSDYDDWEWIILDNSQDGCVKQYVDDFFVSMQGAYYPHCRDKVKCVHESFDGVSVKDGRMGRLYNRCVELTTCGDEGFILKLDSDDFIYPDLLSTIHNVSVEYPSCEAMSGMCNQSLCQFIESGVFTHQTDGMRMWNDYAYEDEIELLRRNGFNGVGFDDYADSCINGGFRVLSVRDVKSKLSIPHIGIEFTFDNATVLNDKGYPFITGFGHPIIFRKGSFLDKLTGFDTEYSVEDGVTMLMPFVLDDVVYINRPVYVQVSMINDNDLSRNSMMLEVMVHLNRRMHEESKLKNLMRVYDILQDCRKTIKPIMYDC